jgi:hypothetical protein
VYLAGLEIVFEALGEKQNQLKKSDGSLANKSFLIGFVLINHGSDAIGEAHRRHSVCSQ